MSNRTRDIATLSPEQRRRLESRLLNVATGSADDRVIPRRATAGPCPLSFAQQRLWFLDRFEPDSPLYNVRRAFRLEGVLDREALREALDAVVARHAVLRTSFIVADGSPVQVIAPHQCAELAVIDLRDRPEAKREAAAQAFLAEEARRAFDLERDVLLRATLVRLAEAEHILLLVVHHIAADGWSMEVLFRELGACYEARSTVRPSPLPELPIQYADFADWQRSWLQGEILTSQLDYWKQQLHGAPAVLELPIDRPRPAIQSFRGAIQVLVLPRSLSERLHAIGRQEGATFFMILLAAFASVLSRYSGQEDMVVGSPIAGRTRVELEGLMGFFVNTLALRIDLSGNPTFRELLARVRAVTLAAYAHQDLPFEKLVEELQPQRSLGHSPLVQVMFVLQNAPQASLVLKDVAVHPLAVGSDTVKFDLTLSLTEQEEGLRASLEYNIDLFDAATARRMLDHYWVLVHGVAADPDRCLANLPLLTEAERHQLLVQGNATTAAYPERPIHELFETQAERTPEAVAVIFENQQLSYRELNQWANRLAHHLQEQGVAPEVLVGICMERSLEMVIGLLGILKAGGAYVPLDPAYPAERLAFMLQDTKMPVLLTQARLRPQLPPSSVRVVCIDAESGSISRHSGSNPASGVSADNLAYVTYTSGSTGRPKGVLVPHRGVVRLLCGVDYAILDPTQTLLQLSPLAFDASTFEIWGALLHGARCVLFPERIPTVGQLGRVLAEHRVSVLWLTSALFNTIIEEAPSVLVGVRQLLVGGEALSGEHVRRALRHLPATAVSNGYGPTEGTTFTCCYRIPPELTVETTSIPIGRPIANTRVYVLDRHRQPVPVGVPGELHIGGAGLARGYLNRPELTAERFLPDPFGAPGARLYRTGDQVRWRADGNLEFLGRLDHQVKLRGYRIELGEVEAVLGQHPQVREAAVLLREDRPGDKRLAAYIVLRDAAGPAPTELRHFLGQKLPAYMVPSTFVWLDALPRTGSGKVDRGALPRPDWPGADLEQGRAGPLTPTEEVLTEIWATVLGLESVGAQDQFFERGGHSLLATRVMVRVQQAFQVEVPLRQLFETPTLADFAQAIEAAVRTRQGPPLPMRSAMRSGDLPLSFAQQRLWFLDCWAPGNSHYNIPVVVRLRGPLDVPALENSFNEIVRRHEAFRTTFPAVEGRPTQAITPALTLTLNVTDLRELASAERETESLRMAAEEAREPFDLAWGPLVRIRLLQLAEAEHLLVLVMHHIISDGWSCHILAQELAVLYECFRAGKPSPLAELPLQYADFAVWQQRWLQGDILQRQLAYWKEHLRGAPSSLALPTDRPRPARLAHRGGSVACTLPPSLTEVVLAVGHQEAATPFMTLLAAFAALLHRCSGQEDLVVGTPLAGRNRPETEPLIGFFVNTLPLRLDLSGQPTFRQLLRRVRQTALGAYTHADLPFERLVEELQPPRDSGRTPLFQVLFVYQSDGTPDWRLPGLEAELVRFATTTAKFDLTLSVSPHDGGLGLALEYSVELFKSSTAEQLLGQFRALLERAVTEPDQPISGAWLPAEKLSFRASRPIDQGVRPVPDRCLPKPEAADGVPRIESEHRLARIWAKVLGLDRVGIRDDFFSLGGHSLLAVQLLARIEQAFGQSLPLATLFQGPTIENLAALLDGRSRSGIPKQVIVLKPQGSRPPLFLLPSLFGDLVHYQELLRYLAADQPVYGLLPCDDNGTMPDFTRLEDMAARILHGLRAFQPKGPYFLAGYSFGGPLAYELAQRLTAAGQRVALLALIETGFSRGTPSSLLDVFRAVPRLLANLPYWVMDDLLQSRPGDLLVRLRRKVKARWKKVCGPGERGEPSAELIPLEELFDLERLGDYFRKRLEMNYRAWSQYEPSVYPGQVTMFQARTGKLWQVMGRGSGLRGLAVGGVVVRTVPGNHDSILEEPHVRVLARRLQDSLDECVAHED